MDEGQQPPHQRRSHQGNPSGRSQEGASSGGLLSRYGGGNGNRPPVDGRQPPALPEPPEPPETPRTSGGGLLSRFANGQALNAFTESVRRAADGVRHRERKPSATDWRASDYDPVAFNAMLDQEEAASRQYRASGKQRNGRRGARGEGDSWDDEAAWQRNWDAGWETGSWDDAGQTGGRSRNRARAPAGSPHQTMPLPR